MLLSLPVFRNLQKLIVFLRNLLYMYQIVVKTVHLFIVEKKKVVILRKKSAHELTIRCREYSVSFRWYPRPLDHIYLLRGVCWGEWACGFLTRLSPYCASCCRQPFVVRMLFVFTQRKRKNFFSRSLFYMNFVINFEIFAPQNEWAALVSARSTARQFGNCKRLRINAYVHTPHMQTHTPLHIDCLRCAKRMRTVYWGLHWIILGND